MCCWSHHVLGLLRHWQEGLSKEERKLLRLQRIEEERERKLREAVTAARGGMAGGNSGKERKRGEGDEGEGITWGMREDAPEEEEVSNYHQGK